MPAAQPSWVRPSRPQKAHRTGHSCVVCGELIQRHALDTDVTYSRRELCSRALRAQEQGHAGRARAHAVGAGGVTMLVLYAPRNEWLALLAQGWVLPWIVDVDRSGYSVLLERDA